MNIAKILTIIGVILVLGIVGFLLWIFAWSLLEADANIKSGVIGLVSVIIVALVTHYQTKKREISARHFSAKREGYMKFIDLFFDMARSVKNNRSTSEKEMIQQMMQFKKALIVWGGQEIIEAWNSFEANVQDGQSTEKMMWTLENILKAIRKDLGHDDSTLPSGSLIALLLVTEDKRKILGQ